MKVLFVTFSDNADHQDIVASMYEAMKGKCNTLAMLTKDPKVPLKQDQNIRLVKCPKRPGIAKGTFNPIDFIRIYRWISRNRFDIVYFESLHLWNVFLLTLLKKGVKTYQMVFDVVPHEGERSSKFVALMNRVVGKLADVVVLADSQHKQMMADMYNIPISKITSIDMARRFPDFMPSRATGQFLFFGRINPYKGAVNLLEIAKRRPNYSFQVFGPVSEEERGIVEQLQGQPNIQVHPGYITGEAMRDAFINADWVLLPYQSATISGVVIDAYRYSRPVIAFAVGAIREQVAEGESGFLVEAGNIDGFCEAMDKVALFTSEQHEKMCREAYEFGSRKYGVANAGIRVSKLFEET